MQLKVKVTGWIFVALSLSYAVYADMQVRLNNGRIYTIPVQAKDVAAIEFTENPPQSGSYQPSMQNSNNRDKLRYQVGPSFMYGTPSAISRVARDGAVVEIEAGEYPRDVAVWKQNNITLRGVGGRAHLQASGKYAEGKAIWVIKGNNVVIENMEFSGAKVPSRNGAGIRMEGSNLTLRNCYFHDNEMGLLTGKNRASEIIVENSEFNNNKVDYQNYKKLGHNIYIGEIAKFTLKGSYIHDAETGHNVKSRARENYILYNRIADEKQGSSYLVDLPNGGDAFIVGNIFQQSSANNNFTLLSFASERNKEKTSSSLYVVNNTLINSAQNAIFISNHGAGLTTVINNLFVGPGTIIKQAGKEIRSANIQLLNVDLFSKEDFAYRLTQTMTDAIDQGVAPEVAKNGFDLKAEYQYLHPAATEKRPVKGAIDIGAYEYVP